jgi:glycerophosphoryl diester phosphodiesterase
VRCIAHRGFALDRPENTLPAFRAAAEGADAVELDVRRCGSGELVVVHDETVDRVTDASGPVAGMDAAALADLRVLDTEAGIPTLAAALDAIPDDVAVNVELKERGLTESLVVAVDGVDNEVLVSSFLPGVLAAVGALPCALLVGPDADPNDAVDRAHSLSCQAIHPHDSLCTDRFVACAHETGLDVNAWTVRNEETARRLAAAGVDGLIADAARFCRSE